MSKSKYISTAVAFAAGLAILATASAAFAATGSAPQGAWQGQGGPHRGAMGMKPGVFGTVSAVSGTTLTINGKQGFGSTSASVVFTVDASNATVKKNNATSTVSSIAVGDMVAVQGTVSGTNVTATSILDGIRPGGMGMKGPGRTGSSTPPVSPITGNGQPVVAGTVSAISGTSITIGNKSNVTYTVDASNAKIVEGQTTISISSIKVGDSLVVQGAINGSSVTASSVIDQTPASGTTKHVGFLGGIGQFFMHLFGF